MKHEIKRRKNTKITTDWCGPTAVALITGCTIDHAASLFAKVQHHSRGIDKTARQVKGVYNSELRAVLNKMGYKMHRIDEACGMTLFSYMTKVQNTEQFRGKMILQIAHHYVTCHRGMVSDNHQLERPVVAHFGKLKKVKKLGSSRKFDRS